VSPTRTQTKIDDWPLLWFARLEAAIGRGDYQTAAQAQRELERLGVTVRYRGRRPGHPEEVTRASS
jgi:hypothetical protein